jgi:hypothetical protein
LRAEVEDAQSLVEVVRRAEVALTLSLVEMVRKTKVEEPCHWSK